MDQWTPPSGATPQQDSGPSDPGNGGRALADILREVKTTMRDGFNHLLQQAGIRVEPGKLVIERDLEVVNAKIKNEWLENPIVKRSTWGEASNFAITGGSGWTPLVSGSLLVPDGYTYMDFDAIGSVLARNSDGSTQYLMATFQRTINGGDNRSSVVDQQTLPSGYWGTAMVPYKWTEDVTPGDVHEWTLMAWAGGGWSAHVDHYARIQISADFTR